MAKKIPPLTSTQVRWLKFGDQTLRDGTGLYLVPQSTGRHAWRLDYRFHGTRKTISLGLYPETGLAEARQRRDQALRLLGDGIDPSASRQETKAAQRAAKEHVHESTENTFEAVAQEWMARQKVSRSTEAKNAWLLDSFLLPELGKRPIRELSNAPREILDVLRKIEATGK